MTTALQSSSSGVNSTVGVALPSCHVKYCSILLGEFKLAPYLSLGLGRHNKLTATALDNSDNQKDYIFLIGID